MLRKVFDFVRVAFVAGILLVVLTSPTASSDDGAEQVSLDRVLRAVPPPPPPPPPTPPKTTLPKTTATTKKTTTTTTKTTTTTRTTRTTKTTTPSTTKASEPGQVNCEVGHEDYGKNGPSVSRTFKQFAIAADNEICAEEGKKIMMRGGSTVDAAIATVLCNGVINPHSSGIGGGSFIVVYLKEKNKVFAIDARERAPKSAYSTMFVNSTKSSLKGGSASGIPGEIYGLYEAYKLGGALPWKELFEPAIRLCQSGYWVSKALDGILKETEASIRKDPAFADLFVNPLTNKLYTIGDRIRRPQLARTLRYISEKGPEAIYNGKLTNIMVEEMNRNGGDVKASDFKEYRAIVKTPIEIRLDSKLRAFTVPPPSSGFLTAFAIKLLASYNMTREFEKDPTIFYHRLLETYKHMFAYRSQIGDENYLDIDKLVKEISSDEKFLKKIRARIVDGKTFPPTYYTEEISKEDHGTSHLAILGPNGDTVSMTTTVNTYFGAFYIGHETGIIYNSQMDDFSTPGAANYFGLQPSKANYIEPGKRPLSSMSPLIILDEKNAVRLVIGASGGSKIISAVSQIAYKHLYLKMPLLSAIDERRVHHQLSPVEAQFEEGFSFALQQRITRYGHGSRCYSGGSVVQGIETDGKRIVAVSDSRKGGVPDGL